jgi:hypothetical protein
MEHSGMRNGAVRYMMLVPTLLIAAGAYSFAEDRPVSVPKAEIEGLAKDLASLQRELEAAQQSAQTAQPWQTVKVTSDKAPIFAGADHNKKVVATAPENKTYFVVDKLVTITLSAMARTMAGSQDRM